MMRRVCRILLLVRLVPLWGCVSVGSLESSSLHHERRARQLAELGDGAGAAREANQAVSDHQAARRRAENRGDYLTSEVLLE
jgi:hypothetical protein